MINLWIEVREITHWSAPIAQQKTLWRIISPSFTNKLFKFSGTSKS